MKLEVRNVKTLETHRGIAFTCTLYVDGKKAASVSQDGHGGGNDYRWSDPDLAKRVHTYAESLPDVAFDGGFLSNDLDLTIENLINDLEVKKQIKRLCKNNQRTVWRTPDMKPEEWRISAHPFTALVVTTIRATHPEAIFANELI